VSEDPPPFSAGKSSSEAAEASPAAPPAPPPQDLLKQRREGISGSGETPSITDFFRDRMEAIELELAKERERAREAEHLLRQQEALRSQADKELKAILLQLKAEKTERERGEERSHAQGRIDALERRLDEMHTAWMTLMKEALTKRDQGSEQASVQAAATSAGLRALSESVAATREQLEAIPQAIARIGETLTERLSEMDRRLASEIRRQEELKASWLREKAAFSEAIEEQRHQIRQEYNKERMALQARFQEQLEGFKSGLERLEKAREVDVRSLARSADLAEKSYEILSRPTSAKDEQVAALEREKQDLLKALQDRTAALRNFTLERRDVERSLGESLMETTRQLQTERSKQQAMEGKIAELEEQLAAGQRREKLHEAVVAERDRLLQSLLEATAKAHDAQTARSESERAWEERLREATEALEKERQRCAAAERHAAELQAKIQALSDHIAQVVRDRDHTESQFAQWKEERSKFISELQKKEELLSMLSSTFQGLLKK